MSLTKRFLSSAAALALPMLALPAVAADYNPPLYDPPVYLESAESAVPVEVGSGWYLRGDLGYAMGRRTSGDFTFSTFPAAGTSSFDAARLDSNFTYGGGIGYRFTDWLRGDMTVDHFTARFNGTTSSPSLCPQFGNCESSASLSAISFMANGYLDLGTYAGFTPYVGGGVGYTLARWGDLTSTCVGLCNTLLPTSSTRAGLSSWRFTYAAMAGLAYDVTPNMKVDVGYRYRNVAGGNMFNFSAGQQAAGASGAQGQFPRFHQHEIRAGLRYELW